MFNPKNKKKKQQVLGNNKKKNLIRKSLQFHKNVKLDAKC